MTAPFDVLYPLATGAQWMIALACLSLAVCCIRWASRVRQDFLTFWFVSLCALHLLALAIDQIYWSLARMSVGELGAFGKWERWEMGGIVYAVKATLMVTTVTMLWAFIGRRWWGAWLLVAFMVVVYPIVVWFLGRYNLGLW